LAEHSQRLRELVAERPDATLEELRNELPVKVCIGTLWKALRCLGLSFKKR
jgi:transposase